MFLSREEVAGVVDEWSESDTDDFVRMLADFAPQGTYDDIGVMIKRSMGARMTGVPIEIAGACMAGFELGWRMAVKAHEK